MAWELLNQCPNLSLFRILPWVFFASEIWVELLFILINQLMLYIHVDENGPLGTSLGCLCIRVASIDSSLKLFLMIKIFWGIKLNTISLTREVFYPLNYKTVICIVYLTYFILHQTHFYTIIKIINFYKLCTFIPYIF